MYLTPASAIKDPALLGHGFTGRSWRRWHAVLKAAYGEHLGKNELIRFREVAERDPPTRPVRELWCIVGRRGGKDSIAAAIATTASLDDYDKYLRPGERASILCLAVDRDQARIVLRYIKAAFATNDMLRPLVERETESGVELSNNVEIIVATNSFRAVRGKTVVVAIFDEVAFWRDESSANPDEEVYAALLPSLATIPNALLVGISTAYRRSGLLFTKFHDHYGQNDPDVLVVKGESRQFNPTLPQSVIEKALARDPDAARAEWLSEWRTDLADFVDRIVVERLVVPGRHEIPPRHDLAYVAFVDPSGGSSDSFTLAVAHRDPITGKAVLDCLRERRPPFSPDDVVREFSEVLKSYGVTTVEGDAYAGEWPRERFRVHGPNYEVASEAKSAKYLRWLPMLNSGQVELLDHPRGIGQTCALERRVGRTGKDTIDHPKGDHDDIANVMAGALIRAGGALVGVDLWAKLGEGPDLDAGHSASLFATGGFR